MRAPSLSRLLKKWAPRLELEAWDIQVLYSRRMANLGECDAEPTNKTATIEIKHPSAQRHDVEATLVHELLHVVTWWTRINGNTSHRNIVGEQSIDTLSRLLVKLDRGEK